MKKVMSVLLMSVLACMIGAGAAQAKGKAKAAPVSVSKVESVNADAKTFKMTGDDKVYKFTDATLNKELISEGAAIKLTLKDGSIEDVIAVDTAAPAKAAAGKKGGKKGKK